MPILCSSLPIDTPGALDSTTNAEMPREWPSLGSVTANTTNRSATPRFVIQFFSPLITHSSPSRTARVRMPPGSEPASTSDRAKAGVHSPLASRGR